MAVGGVGGTGASHPFTARFDGTAWSALPAAKHEPADAELSGISCVSATWCVAVGHSTKALIEQWNGTAWTVAKSVSPDTGGNVLADVTCLSKSWCRAVGDAFDSGGESRTLIEAWNGRAWSLVRSPDDTALSNWLDGISCTTTAFCQAVGFFATDGGDGKVVQQTLAERWDGRHWTLSPTKDRIAMTNDLYSVSCATTKYCIAVGRDETLQHNIAADVSEAQLWNGSTWSLVSTPLADSSVRTLSDVTCPAPRSCTIVGNRTQPGAKDTSVITVRGAAWSAQSSPNRATSKDNQLAAVSCPTSSRCEAVGYDLVGHTEQTLAERGP